MIYELFSSRSKKAEASDLKDVFQYDEVSQKLRVQIQQILNGAIGPQYQSHPYEYRIVRQNANGWRRIHQIICRELGRHRLVNVFYALEIEGVLNYIGSANAENFVDALEVCCRYIEQVIGALGEYQRAELGIVQGPEAAIYEINHRMREASFGYTYSDGQMFRVDSEFTHEEVIKPALRFLSGESFLGAQQEFLEAHRHFRSGEAEKSIVYAGRAFESTLKSICLLKGWNFDRGARSSDLLKIVRSKGLWPDFLDASLDQLLATLNSGLPKVRNDLGAHGQGPVPRAVPTYIAAYALNLCASKIVLLVDAAKSSGSTIR